MPPQFDRFFLDSADFCCVLDHLGRIHTANATLQTVLGYEQQEVAGFPFTDLVHHEDRLETTERLSQMPTLERTVEFRIRCRHKDGSLRWLDCSCTSPAEDAGWLYVICRDVTLQKQQVEDRLTELTNRDAAVLGIAGSIIYQRHTDTKEEVWAGAYRSLLGYTAEEMPRRMEDWLSRIHTDDRRAVEQAIEAALVAKSPIHMQYRVQRKDGSYAQVRDDARFFSDAEGRLEKLVGIVTDVSDVKSSEERFRQAIQSAPIGVLIVDEQGRIRFLNPQIESLFGYSASELQGRMVEILVPEKHRAQHPQLREEFRHKPESRILGVGRYLTGQHKYGFEIPLEIGIGPLPSSEGMMFVCTIVDRREFESARAALTESERQLSDIIDHSSSVIYVKDIDGRYVLVNRRFEFLFNLERDQITGCNDFDLFPTEMAESLRRNDREVLTQGQPQQIEENVPHADGTHTYLSVKFPLQDVHGDTYAIAGISTDITDRLKRQHAEREMATAQMVQSFLYPKASPRLPFFDVAGSVSPAAQLCGDYLDFIPLDEHHWLVAVGDICGHGLGPALHVVGTRAYLRAIVDAEGPNFELDRAVSQLNAFLRADMHEGRFLSMFLVLIDDQNSLINYLGAGHDALLVRSDDHIQRVGSNGLILGIMPDVQFRTAEPVEFQPGDVLVIVTDGVIESTNQEREQYGRDRLSEVVLAHRWASSTGIVAAIRESVENFSAGVTQNDDITIAVIKGIQRRPPPIARSPQAPYP